MVFFGILIFDESLGLLSATLIHDLKGWNKKLHNRL